MYYFSSMQVNYNSRITTNLTFSLNQNLIFLLNHDLTSNSSMQFNKPVNASSKFLELYDLSYNSEVIKYTDIEPHIFITNKSSIYNKNTSVANYYLIDVTEWIWSRFDPNITNSNIQLLVFKLEDLYTIKIGTGI